MDINFSPLAPPLKEQIEALSDKDAERLDLHRHAINRLRIHGILTRAEAIRANERLLKEIASALRRGDEG